MSVDPWDYSEDGTVIVAEYAVVQVGRVTLEYSEYIAHDLFQAQKEPFVSGLRGFHDKASELINLLESSS